MTIHIIIIYIYHLHPPSSTYIHIYETLFAWFSAVACTEEKIVQWPAARPLPTAEPATGISDFLDARFWNSAV